MNAPRISRASYVASLAMLAERGVEVRTVIDVGAAEGGFLLLLRWLNLFPDAQHLFIDAMEENERLYKLAKEAFGHPYAIAALSCVEGEAKLRVDPNVYNTHLTSVQDHEEYGRERRVPLRTLDNVVKEAGVEGPYLVKLDVQGAELDVLRGGIATLAKASIVQTEIQIFLARDNLTELLTFMKGEGFTLFDLTGLAHYPSNGLLYQCDATFMRKEMDTRLKDPWVTPDQERSANEQLQARRIHGTTEFERFCQAGRKGRGEPEGT